MGRYLAGIDLGTTNSAIAYIDTSTKAKFPEIKLHQVFQLDAPSELQPHSLLPSFLYLPGGHDLPEGAAALPWDKSRSFIVGNFARSQGAKVPGRLVSSAKSWLCHPGVDRKAPLLPWAAPPEVSRLSPLDVSAKYLKHIVESWNHSVSLGQLTEPLENQTVVVTVPASFDDIARSLTMEGAKLAGLKNVLLLEEPQAAFYRWLSLHQQNKTKEIELSEGMQCLVIDVGGGTTDFTLIETISENGAINFLRKAVGDHLLLGGDNMDLALAKLMESRFPAGTKLDASQYIQLTQACRNAKEQILSDTPPETIPINIMGRGRSIVAGLIRAELSSKEAASFILDGFFPLVNKDSAPIKSSSQTGLHEMGLPYVSDPAITKHLASFLNSQSESASFKAPAAVLFNGGVFRSKKLQNQILSVIDEWGNSDPNKQTTAVFENPSVDLAVAEGAAWFAWLKHSGGKHIGGGLAKSYYLGVGNDSGEETLICVLPKHHEEGKILTLDQNELELAIGQPVLFPLFTSTLRSKDQAGAVIKIPKKQLQSLPPLQTILRGGKRSGVKGIPVNLKSQATALGTLELWCIAKEGSNEWKLEFNLRDSFESSDSNSDEENRGDTWPEATAIAAIECLHKTFSNSAPEIDPKLLPKFLENILDAGRDDWPLGLCRRLWDDLFSLSPNRLLSPDLASRWSNLAGFFLRPGYGAPGDKIRLDKLWKELIAPPRDDRSKSSIMPRFVESGAEFWILWRRVSGGLSSNQQQSLFDRIRNIILPIPNKPVAKPLQNELVEMWRAAASFERLDLKTKENMGNTLIRSLKKTPLPPYLFWSLTRLASRALIYGPLNSILHPDIVSQWVTRLLEFQPSHASEETTWAFCLSQMGRITGQRALDLDQDLRNSILTKIRDKKIPAEWIKCLEEFVPLAKESQSNLLGDSLPVGLRLYK